MARRSKRRGKNSISNVRVVDEYSGTDGARIERMLSSIQNSQSQVRIEIGLGFGITTSAGPTDTLGLSTIRSLRDQDEWATMSSQWNQFRVRAIRYDVYDINPNLVAFSCFSTFHETVEGSTANFSFAQVLDGPDSQVATNGQRLRFTWVAKGTNEMAFQNVDPNLETFADFGGFRYAVGPAASAASKFQVVAKAIVDFRGRY